MRRRSIKKGQIEELIRLLAVRLVPKFRGPNFTWEWFAKEWLEEGCIEQLELALFKIHPLHREEIKALSIQVAAEYKTQEA